MSCRAYRGDLIELARGAQELAAARAHAARCPQCREFLDEQMALTRAALALRADSPRLPDAPDQRLMTEFAHVRAPRKSPRMRRVVAGLAIAASLALGWLAVRPHSKPASQVAVRMKPAPNTASMAPPVKLAIADSSNAIRQPKRRARIEESADSNPFVPIPWTTPLAPYERATILRVEMPVSALIAAGLPVGTSDVGANVEADLMVGEDGRAKAVRVVNVAER